MEKKKIYNLKTPSDILFFIFWLGRGEKEKKTIEVHKEIKLDITLPVGDLQFLLQFGQHLKYVNLTLQSY